MRSRFRQNYRFVGHVCYNTCITGDEIYLCCFCGTRDDFFPVLAQDIELRTRMDMEAFVVLFFSHKQTRFVQFERA